MAAPMSKRVFPWVSREEWEEVYYGLYTDYGSDASSSSAVAKQWAIKRTQLWRSRSGNRFPPGVETTVCLAQALLLLLEEERERSKTRERCDEVRLLLSMAIVRFVNFVADVGQKNTFRAQPVHVLAGMKGVPEWVVDLRHTATHATLPSLSILVLGAEFALTWLQNQYWEVERARLSPSPINRQTSAGEACVIKKGKKEEEEEEGEEEREERIRSLLGDYQQLQFQLMTGAIRTIGEKERAVDARGRAVASLCRVAVSNADNVMRVIAADGFIAMTTEQTAALGVEDIEDDEEPLPDAVVLFWRPLVRALHSHGLVPLTALSLLEALREEEHVAPSRRATILKWVARILEDSSCRVLPSSRRRVNLFARRTKAADWRPVLRLLLQLPCCHTAAMLKSLFSLLCPPLPRKRQVQLLKLTGLVAEDDPDGCRGDRATTPPREQTYTVEQLQGPQREGTTEDGENGGGSAKTGKQELWRKTKDVAWSMLPMGRVPGRSDPGDLVLPPSVDRLQRRLPGEGGSGGSGGRKRRRSLAEVLEVRVERKLAKQCVAGEDAFFLLDRIGNLGNEEAGVDLEQSVNDNVEVKETIGNCFREEAFWDEAQMNDIKKHLNIY